MTVDNSTENPGYSCYISDFQYCYPQMDCVPSGTTDRTLTLWINSGYEFPGDKHIHKKFLRNAQN